MEQVKRNRWYISQFDRRETDSPEQPVEKLQILNVFNLLFSSQLVLTKYNKLLTFTACSKKNKSLINFEIWILNTDWQSLLEECDQESGMD